MSKENDFDDAAEPIRDVNRHIAERRFQEALDLCEAIQLQDMLPRKFWFLKGQALEGLGENRRAIEAYRCQIAALARGWPDLLGHIGNLLADEGEYFAGALCLGASCEAKASVERLVLYASAVAHQGNLAEAVTIVRRAIDLEPNYDEAWHNLGAYLLEENPIEAENAFRHALALNPKRSDSFGGIGRAYLAQGRNEEAVDIARTGIEINPLDGICRQVEADGLESLNEWDLSHESYLMAFRCDYDKPHALLGVARLFERTNQLDEARQWLVRGVRAWPDHAKIRHAYQRFVTEHGSDDVAMRDFTQTINSLRNSLRKETEE